MLRAPPWKTVLSWVILSLGTTLFIFFIEAYGDPLVARRAAQLWRQAQRRQRAINAYAEERDEKGGDGHGFVGSGALPRSSDLALYWSALRAGWRVFGPHLRRTFLRALASLVGVVYATATLGLAPWLPPLAAAWGLGRAFDLVEGGGGGGGGGVGGWLGGLLRGWGGWGGGFVVEAVPVTEAELEDLPELVHGHGSSDDLFDPLLTDASTGEVPPFAHAFDPRVGMVPREVYDRWRENEGERRQWEANARRAHSLRRRPPVRRPLPRLPQVPPRPAPPQTPVTAAAAAATTTTTTTLPSLAPLGKGVLRPGNAGVRGAKAKPRQNPMPILGI